MNKMLLVTASSEEKILKNISFHTQFFHHVGDWEQIHEVLTQDISGMKQVLEKQHKVVIIKPLKLDIELTNSEGFSWKKSYALNMSELKGSLNLQVEISIERSLLSLAGNFGNLPIKELIDDYSDDTHSGCFFEAFLDIEAIAT